MQGTHSSLLLLALAFKSLATPLNLAGQKAFTIDQVASGLRSSPGPAHLVWSPYGKYASAGAVAPEKLLAAVKNETGSVAAEPGANDLMYTSPIEVGGQSLNVTIDTGSSDFWVFSTLLPDNETYGHSLYDPKKSPTAKLLNGYSWNITYESGQNAYGDVYTDTLTVGEVTATAQAVEAAKDLSASLTEQFASDGVLGLSFDKINTVKPVQQKTFFENIEASLAKKLFAANLQHQQPGSFDFGFINEKSYTGEITYTPVNSTAGFWLFDAGGYSTGDSQSLSGHQGLSVADTGTSLMYVTQAVITEYFDRPLFYHKLVDFDGIILFVCNVTLPDFHTSIGGTTFTVPGEYLNVQQVPGTTPQVCLSGLQVSTGLPFQIYGDVFLKTVYAIYDQTQAKPRLGFAKKPLSGL